AYLKPLDLYPPQALETQLEGTVRVAFRVQPSGHLTEFRIVRSRGPLLDRAALEAATRLPRWYPAHRGGVAVASLVILPITFRLD
ncbi:MAG: energy transducer TonB, partial [Sphingobacteriaceae bacterium]|nr:energy transducer TonB [Cytophagaceae bacterium]